MFSATDVANFLACHHLMTLDRAQASGQLKKPFFHDPSVELLRELGTRHERAYFRHVSDAQGLEIAEIPVNLTRAESAAHTLDALHRGVSVVYQGTFQHGPWHGRSDFLVRVERPSALGAWSYEALETKLARSTKAGALIQLCFYSDLLSQIQGVQPEWMHVVLGRSTNPEKYPVGQYIAYFRKIKRDFDASCKGSANTYPEPNDHCYVCSWDPICDKRRHEDDHLSLVAGISRNQRKALVARDVTTVTSLSQLDMAATPKLDGIGNAALRHLRHCDQLFLVDTAKRVRRGLEGLIRRGLHTGGKCFGYRSRKDPDGVRLEVFEPEAAIVRRIFQLYVNGHSLKAIAKKLNQDGIVSPQPQQGRVSRSWCPSSIRTMLHNERYLGKVIWSRKHKVRDPKTGRRVSRSREGERPVIGADAPHLRIVSDELWQAVRSRQETREVLYEDSGKRVEATAI